MEMELTEYRKRKIERERKLCEDYLRLKGDKSWRQYKIFERLMMKYRIGSVQTIYGILQENGILQGKTKDRRRKKREI